MKHRQNRSFQPLLRWQQHQRSGPELQCAPPDVAAALWAMCAVGGGARVAATSPALPASAQYLVTPPDTGLAMSGVTHAALVPARSDALTSVCLSRLAGAGEERSSLPELPEAADRLLETGARCHLRALPAPYIYMAKSHVLYSAYSYCARVQLQSGYQLRAGVRAYEPMACLDCEAPPHGACAAAGMRSWTHEQLARALVAAAQSHEDLGILAWRLLNGSAKLVSAAPLIGAPPWRDGESLCATCLSMPAVALHAGAVAAGGKRERRQWARWLQSLPWGEPGAHRAVQKETAAVLGRAEKRKRAGTSAAKGTARKRRATAQTVQDSDDSMEVDDEGQDDDVDDDDDFDTAAGVNGEGEAPVQRKSRARGKTTVKPAKASGRAAAATQPQNVSDAVVQRFATKRGGRRAAAGPASAPQPAPTGSHAAASGCQHAASHTAAQGKSGKGQGVEGASGAAEAQVATGPASPARADSAVEYASTRHDAAAATAVEGAPAPRAAPSPAQGTQADAPSQLLGRRGRRIVLDPAFVDDDAAPATASAPAPASAHLEAAAPTAQAHEAHARSSAPAPASAAKHPAATTKTGGDPAPRDSGAGKTQGLKAQLAAALASSSDSD
jgi:hypothetical protein